MMHCFMKIGNGIFHFSSWTYFCHLQVNLVDWLKMMVASRRSEEVVDPTIETRPSTRALKRALLTALRCVDPDSEKRPKMGQVVRMLESDDPIPRGVCPSKNKNKKINKNPCLVHSSYTAGFRYTYFNLHTEDINSRKQDRRSKHHRGGSTEMDSQRENNSDTEKSDNPDSKPSRSRTSSSKWAHQHFTYYSLRYIAWSRLLPFYIADELVTESSEACTSWRKIYFSFLFVVTIYDLFVEKVLVFYLSMCTYRWSWQLLL